MKKLILLLFTIPSALVYGQSDFCSGTVPTLTVGAGCTPTNYNIASGFADNFTTEPSCGMDYRDGFFQFTATGTSAMVTVTDPLNGPDPGVMVLSGTCGGGFTELGCSETGNNVNEVVTIPTTPGTVYTVVIFRSNNASSNDMTGTICVQNPPQGSSCDSPQPITVGGTYCNTNSYPGSFDDDEITSWNPCSSLYSDGEYWFSIVGTGQALSLNMSGLSDTYSGVFIYSGCPSSGGACIGQATAGASSANYAANTPVLTAGVTYYIAVINWSTPYSTDFCLTPSVYSGPVVASDCPNYVNICSNSGFQIDPNGYGAVDEIPALGTLGNPDYGSLPGSSPAHLGGSINAGCLRIGESNSTWMVINVYTAGNLEFSFGAGGSQAGFYDWIMYPYSGAGTCAAITANTVAPVRCNWNSVSSGGTGLASTLPAGGNAGNYEPALAVTANSQYIICFSNFSSATSTVPLAFSGSATVGCSALSNDLQNFAVTSDCENEQAFISWETPLSTSNTYEVQRSYTGEIWEIIGTVNDPVSTSDNKKTFQFRDELQKDEMRLYRLKEIKSDIFYNYSELKSVICKSQVSPNTLAPNPSSDLTNLSYYSKSEGMLYIFDALGRTIDQIPLENTKGQLILKPIDVSKLQNGIYRFVISLDTGSTTIQFIKK